MKKMPNHATTTIPVIDALDRAIACQENIFVLAVLLEDSHENLVLSGAGRLIANEARKLGDMLLVLEEQYPRPTKRPRSGASIRPRQT
jgi:hypothetical protein